MKIIHVGKIIEISPVVGLSGADLGEVVCVDGVEQYLMHTSIKSSGVEAFVSEIMRLIDGGVI
ncbi:hypothetical protein IHN32_02980 [Deinococcus sp. 14RED07]|uniref:hypothetical protein n=1 Tax=unclassified Deinococcus TaxID=2623546 RepID=UPI001E3F8F18|nr:MULTISPECIES: hypothetical protein [unclassified Deinococcus]MCD0160246.1 hypothetical protein [Deinococcus sp. 6YEL10]MCD0174918.1 hypothetical protein [Deinococcus sp. 14RED07]